MKQIIFILFFLCPFIVFAYVKNDEIWINCEVMGRNVDVLTYLHITKQEALKIKTLYIYEYQNMNTLPINASDFKNVKKIVIESNDPIYGLKGLSDFKNIKSLSISVSSRDEDVLSQLFWDTEIWKLKTLKDLSICAPLINLSDSILNLKKLKRLKLVLNVFPVETILKMNWLKDFSFATIHCDPDCQSIDTYMYLSNKFPNKMLNLNFTQKQKEQILYKLEGTVENDTNYKFNNRIPVNGYYCLKYLNGRNAVEGTYLNGKRNGEWSYYKNNGECIIKDIYVKGKLVTKKYNGIDSLDHFLDNTKKIDTISYTIEYKDTLNSLIIIETYISIHSKKTKKSFSIYLNDFDSNKVYKCEFSDPQNKTFWINDINNSTILSLNEKFTQQISPIKLYCYYDDINKKNTCDCFNSTYTLNSKYKQNCDYWFQYHVNQARITRNQLENKFMVYYKLLK